VNEVTVASVPEVNVLCVIIDLDGFSIQGSERLAVQDKSSPGPHDCQLFTATVASKIDYVAFRCCPIRLNNTVTAEIEQPFEIVQRVALQATAGGSPNAALVINDRRGLKQPSCAIEPAS
jgi:hypothetical protein